MLKKLITSISLAAVLACTDTVNAVMVSIAGNHRHDDTDDSTDPLISDSLPPTKEGSAPRELIVKGKPPVLAPPPPAPIPKPQPKPKPAATPVPPKPTPAPTPTTPVTKPS